MIKNWQNYKAKLKKNMPIIPCSDKNQTLVKHVYIRHSNVTGVDVYTLIIPSLCMSYIRHTKG